MLFECSGFECRCLEEPEVDLPIAFELQSDTHAISVNHKACRDGRYQCFYISHAAGFFRLSITVHGRAISGSPFSVQVRLPDESTPAAMCATARLEAVSIVQDEEMINVLTLTIDRRSVLAQQPCKGRWAMDESQT